MSLVQSAWRVAWCECVCTDLSTGDLEAAWLLPSLQVASLVIEEPITLSPT